MTNAIKLGKTIYQKLKESTEIKKLVGNRIYPLVAEQTTTFPFLVYYRTNLTSDGSTKDGYTEDLVEFVVVCASDKYSVSCDLANETRRTLERRTIITEELTINFCSLASAEEAYEDNTFLQKLTFNCRVTN